MRRATFVLISGLLAGDLLAVRHIGFETDAFNRAYPANYAKTICFSPASFEIDCTLLAESLPTIPKAKVSETMGVVIDFESAYRPILERFAACTNGFSLRAARAFCVPDIRKAQPAHMQFLQRVYEAEVLPARPKAGAESWFRAMLDGEMEDFELPSGIEHATTYGFYDLVSIRWGFRDPFPTDNTRTMPFTRADGTKTNLAFMADVRVADSWRSREYTLLQLPMADDAMFYALMPTNGVELAQIRNDISSLEIDTLLTVAKSVTDPRTYRGPTAVVVPKMSIRSRLDFTGVLRYFRMQTGDLANVTGSARAREYVQHVRFELSEGGCGAKPLAAKSAEEEVRLVPGSRTIALNRPFLFFIYHAPTATIPVAGQFTGFDR